MTVNLRVQASVDRYSMKCLRSGPLGAPRVTQRRLVRGRSYALSDTKTEKAAGAEPAQKLPNVFDYRAGVYKSTASRAGAGSLLNPGSFIRALFVSVVN
jgi:hypothetical protein